MDLQANNLINIIHRLLEKYEEEINRREKELLMILTSDIGPNEKEQNIKKMKKISFDIENGLIEDLRTKKHTNNTEDIKENIKEIIKEDIHEDKEVIAQMDCSTQEEELVPVTISKF